MFKADHEVEFLPIHAAARLLGINRARIARAVRDGLIPATRPGTRWVYVHLDDVRAWLRDQRAPESDGAVHFARSLIRRQTATRESNDAAR